MRYGFQVQPTVRNRAHQKLPQYNIYQNELNNTEIPTKHLQFTLSVNYATTGDHKVQT